MNFSRLILCLFICFLKPFSFQGQQINYQRDNTSFEISQNFKKSNNVNIPVIQSSVRIQIPSKTFTLSGTITLTITTEDATCEDYNGKILVWATGGTAPYTFALSNGRTLQTGNFVGVRPGTYTVTVTDQTGESATANVTIVNHLEKPRLIGPALTDALDCTSPTGSIVFTADRGLPPYRYTLDKINYQSSGAFNNLQNGVYMPVVEDANGCTDYRTEIIGVNSNNCPWANSGGLTYATCTNTGSITVGTRNPVYYRTYSMDGINFTPEGEFRNLPAGIHYVYTKNILTGEIGKTGFSIWNQCMVRLDFVTVDAACGQNDGQLTAVASEGTAPYSFTIDGFNYQSSNVFTGLAPGFYYVTVKDAAGLTDSWITEVKDKCPVVSAVTTNDNCNQSNGTITASAEKGEGPYQYSIDGSNFQSSNVFTGLAAGNYTITLKDAQGNTATTTSEVKSYCFSVSATATHVVCGNRNGNITVSVLNGNAPFVYSIDGINFQGNNVFNNLAAGPYTVTVRDGSNEMATITIQINDAPAPTITVTTLPTRCSFNSGEIEISALGGTAPLTYSINGTNYQNGNTFSGLASGSYTAYVKDANNCIVNTQAIIALNCPTITANTTNESCGNRNGSITVNVTNANAFAPHQYSIDGTNFQNTNQFTGLGAGTYTITIKDALNYLHTTTAVVANNCPVATLIATNETCGSSNGIIKVSGSNGTPPYAFSIDGINFQTSASFTGLQAGYYTVTIKDAGGSQSTSVANLIDIPGPQLSVLSTGAASCLSNDGTVQLIATGGSATFQYSINAANFQVGNQFTGLASGIYTATVKDANGCIATVPLTIPMNNNLVITPAADKTICQGEKTVLPMQSNGISFAWSPAATLNNPTILQPTANPLITTKYYLNASLGVCKAVDSIIVKVNPAPIANAGLDVSICYGQNAQLNGSGGVSYQWFPSMYLSTTVIADPVAVKPQQTMTYQLQVTDNKGCKSIQASSVKVIVIPTAKVFAGNDTAIVINQPFQLFAKDVNNSGFTGYSWSPNFGMVNNTISNPVISIDRDMLYTVRATTAAGCESIDEVSIKVYKGPDIYVPTAFTPNGDGRNDVLYAVPVGIRELKRFSVFNRGGQIVFTTTNASMGWDGKLKGFVQSTGVFVWIAEGVDDKGKIVTRKGTVTLIL